MAFVAQQTRILQFLYKFIWMAFVAQFFLPAKTHPRIFFFFFYMYHTMFVTQQIYIIYGNKEK